MSGIAVAAHRATAASSSRKLGLGDVQAAGRDRRAQLDQDRPQVNLDGQGMARPSRRS